MGDVTVRFSGVAAVGPGRPRKEPFERKGPFYAVFPDSSRRQAIRPGAGYIPFHHPVMITKQPPANDPFCRIEDETVGAFYLWYPLGERLFFVVDGKMSGHLTYDDPKEGVADMRDVWPEKSIMPEDAIATWGPMKNPAVRGQVFIPFGCVGSDGERKRVRFEPARTPEPYNATIASQTVITFPAQRIEIHSTSLVSGRPLDMILFADVPRTMEIHISNADPRDIRKIIKTRAYDKTADEKEVDADFELYYSILAPDVDQGLPVPVEKKNRLIRNCYVVMTTAKMIEQE